VAHVIGVDDQGRQVTATQQEVAAMARDLEITIDEVERIAKQTLTDLRARTEEKRSELSGDTLTRDKFGDSPAGAALGDTYAGARDVFLSTVEAVMRDLESFRDRLLDVLREYRGRDEAGEELLLQATRRAEGLEYTAENAKADAYAANSSLIEPEEAGAGETDPAAPTTGPPLGASSPAPSGGKSFDGDPG
jgi:hypothetical protein